MPGNAGGATRLAGCILLSSWLDLTADRAAVPELVRRDVVLSPAWLEACAQAYASAADRTQNMASPLHASLCGLPPLLIQCGTDDVLAPDAENLADRAAAAGVDVTYTQWPGLWHDFALQPGITAAADSALTQAAWFVGRVTAPDGPQRLADTGNGPGADGGSLAGTPECQYRRELANRSDQLIRRQFTSNEVKAGEESLKAREVTTLHDRQQVVNGRTQGRGHRR